jgi:hypothetical protein
VLLSLLLAVGCSPGTISLGEDVVDGEVLDPSLDTAEDTATAEEGDTSVDSGSPGGGDTGGNAGGGGTDTAGTTDPLAGSYTGSVEGSLDVGRGDIGCTGSVSFTVDASGNVSGTANCTIREWGLELAGSLSGTEVGGNLEATWNIDLRGYPVPNDVRGTISGREATLRFEDDVSWANFSGAMSARR